MVLLLVLVLLPVWTCCCAGDCTQAAGRRQPQQGHRDRLAQDAVTEHMQHLYRKYNKDGAGGLDGNTVRSFKAHWGVINKKPLQIFNLTSLTKSEDVLSATLHYYIGDLQNGSRARPRGHSQVHALIWSFAPEGDGMRTLGEFRINASTQNQDFISWQWKDVTLVVHQAKQHQQILIGIQVSSRESGPWKELLAHRSPYILVYANDSAISEPESVVAALRRKPAPGDRDLLLDQASPREPNASDPGGGRPRRSLDVPLPLQNNELPGPEYSDKWERAYRPLEAKRARRPGKNQKKSLLHFDERTIKKARKKQWKEARKCARRYLKVDFADIGWSDWIISPKSFEAFYCSGSCHFPMPKALRPSNHATIQSIVRAVGVVPGVPEPCCVPETMASLSVLFFDEDRNVVLKVYPNMTVDSCACR
ncbi:bone morphogenetic protein 3 [Nerophis ophidion]|uniref:bone morphogenetic protein 3 n=1 Tax=Nerophis ophidion TaxID=159077 RepID=UPI002ADFC260|nr:bone morphogenetic protein 3 [Nerophis ophidion]